MGGGVGGQEGAAGVDVVLGGTVSSGVPRPLPSLTGLPPAGDGYRPLLSSEDIRQLLPHLPSRCMGKDLPLLFSSQRDGYSLATLYSRAKNTGPTLLVVLDESQSVFGGFASRDWSGHDYGTTAAHSVASYARGSVGYMPSPHRGRTSDSWFGSGDAFLFSLRPTFAVHRWTRSNNEFQLAKENCLAFGGGGYGKFGLWLDGNLEKGSTGPCETYGNPPLSQTTGETFRVVRVELYGFGDVGVKSSIIPKDIGKKVLSLIQERRLSTKAAVQ